MKCIIIYCTLIALMASIMPAQAYWNETGFPLEDNLIAQGSVNGSVYVGGGHGSRSGLTEKNVPYTELFEVPEGNITFARLYTGGMFCSSTSGATWLDMTLNGESLGNLTIEGKSDTNDNVYIYESGSGGWIYYDVTDKVVPGAINNATLYGDVISGSWGGTKYIQGIVMVVVYEDPDKPETQYWIREGADYLHKEFTYTAEKKNTTTTFPGADNKTCENATLYTIGYFSHAEYNETLWVNGKLAASNIAGERNGNGFDINRTEITPYLQESGNYVTYERGDGTIMIGTVVLILGQIEIIPDLTVQKGLDVSLKTGEETIGVVANHDYVVGAEIKNKGTGASNETTATLHVDGVFIETTEVPSIDPIDTATIAFNWRPASEGVHTLNVTIDPVNAVNESIEFNNLLSQDVYVHSDGVADVLPEIAFLPTRFSNATTIRATIINNGTADVHDLKVSLVMDGVTVADNTLSLSAKSTNTTEFVYSAEHLSTHTAEIKLDPDGVILESDDTNNNISDTLNVISVRTISAISWVNTSVMFDVTKLVPKGANPLDVLESVANVTYEDSGIPNINGVNLSTEESKWFRMYINGLLCLVSTDALDYQLRGGEVACYVYDSYLGVSRYSFAPRPVLVYPEPFLHGYEGMVPDTTIVYSAGFEGDADAIRNQLVGYGVVNITTTLAEDVTDNQTANENLILIGTPDANDLIREVSDSYYLVGLPVHFKDGLMYDVTTGSAYSAGGIVAACDNPFDNSPGVSSYRDTGPAIMIASGIDDASAHTAASLLATPDQLDECWIFVSPTDVLKGDLNSDNDITTADAVIALQMAAGSRTPDIARGDVSGDGMVTSLDALMIMQAAARNIEL